MVCNSFDVGGQEVSVGPYQAGIPQTVGCFLCTKSFVNKPRTCDSYVETCKSLPTGLFPQRQIVMITGNIAEPTRILILESILIYIRPFIFFANAKGETLFKLNKHRTLISYCCQSAKTNIIKARAKHNIKIVYFCIEFNFRYIWNAAHENRLIKFHLPDTKLPENHRVHSHKSNIR